MAIAIQPLYYPMAVVMCSREYSRLGGGSLNVEVLCKVATNLPYSINI